MARLGLDFVYFSIFPLINFFTCYCELWWEIPGWCISHHPGLRQSNDTIHPGFKLTNYTFACDELNITCMSAIHIDIQYVSLWREVAGYIWSPLVSWVRPTRYITQELCFVVRVESLCSVFREIPVPCYIYEKVGYYWQRIKQIATVGLSYW